MLVDPHFPNKSYIKTNGSVHQNIGKIIPILEFKVKLIKSQVVAPIEKGFVLIFKVQHWFLIELSHSYGCPQEKRAC